MGRRDQELESHPHPKMLNSRKVHWKCSIQDLTIQYGMKYSKRWFKYCASVYSIFIFLMHKYLRFYDVQVTYFSMLLTLLTFKNPMPNPTSKRIIAVFSSKAFVVSTLGYFKKPMEMEWKDKLISVQKKKKTFENTCKVFFFYNTHFSWTFEDPTYS